MSTARGDFDLVGHRFAFPFDPTFDPHAWMTNIVIEAKKPDDAWIEAIMRQIGLWRAKLRSTYLRWALCINGLEVAAQKYADATWASTHSFVVRSIRPNGKGTRTDGAISVDDKAIIAKWDGKKASDAHRDTIPMVSAFGIIDLYGNIEEVIFEMYRLFLTHNPADLLRGDDHKCLRKLKREAEADPSKRAEWDTAWRHRLDAWQRKRLYDGLGKIFRAFCATANLTAPSTYRVSTVDTWAESIETIALVRNALVHGATTVSEELADACKRAHAIMFNFQKDEPLTIRLYHLQGVDFFCEQLLTAINLSLIERMRGPLGKRSEAK
ncbi:hypothetical protein [Sorangium sp. So ce124]|uniref:hypothetical protein n=1 Tax=Sorangium sp. So ce124 TaxID=3133280 RepID=UPI003F642833